MRGNVLCHDAPSPDERVSTDLQPADNCDVGPESGPNPDGCREEVVVAMFDVGSRSQIVGERDRWSEEHIVFDHDPVPDQYSVLDRDAVTKSRTTFNEGVIANVAVTSDNSSGHDMCKCPNSCTTTDLITLAEAERVDKHEAACGHAIRSSRSTFSSMMSVGRG